MFKNYFQNLKIRRKILIIILGISLIAQIVMMSLMFFSITKFSAQTKNEITNLNETVSEKTETALKKQNISYTDEIANSMANTSDNALAKINDNILILCNNMENIYLNPRKTSLNNILFPELTSNKNETTENQSKLTAYAIDFNNSSTDDNIFLIYNTDLYNSEKTYRTNIEDWKNLDENEREKIKNDKTIISNKHMPSQIENELNNINNINYLMRSIYKNNLAISSIYLGTESGIYYQYSPDGLSEHFNPKVRPWYIDAVNAEIDKKNSLIWQNTYISKNTHAPCITCSKAFTDSKGNILGVIAIDINIDKINKFIIGTTAGDTGYAFVVNSEGQIIIHPDYKSENFNFNPLNSDNIDISYKNLINKMKSNGRGMEKVKIDNKYYYVTYSPLSVMGWCIGIASEEEKVVQPIDDIHNFILTSYDNTNKSINSNFKKILVSSCIILFFCITLTAIISIKLTDEILVPIKKLGKQAKIIGEGNFSSRIINNSDDELGDLSQSFNKMAENLNLYMNDLKATTKEKEKIRSELAIAKQIQKSMLPYIFPAFPERKDFDIYALMEPAREVGGDFYDFFFIDKDHFAIVIADVSGKGISAALFMVIAKILIKNQLQNCNSPSETLENVNSSLYENNEANMFITAFLGIINIKTGEFTFSNAGHNAPLLYKKSTDKYTFIDIPRGFIAGYKSNVKYAENKISIEPGDTIFLYTDGVTEAMDSNDNLFSKERLESILNTSQIKKSSPKETIVSLRQEINNFVNGTPQSDDITMLAFKNFKISKNMNDNLDKSQSK